MVLGVNVEERTSPTDPSGMWFDEVRVREAAQRLQAKQRQSRPFTFTDEELAERAEWARLKGFTDWGAFLDAVERGKQSVLPFLAWSRARRGEAPTVDGFKTPGQAIHAA